MTRDTRLWAVVVALSLVLAACNAGSDGSGENSSDTADGGQVLVTPDLTVDTIVVNVAMTDTGFEPSTIFLPAGRHVELVLRNRGEHEHHYRIAGLIPFDLEWYVYPDMDGYVLDEMTDEERADLGIDEDEPDLDHVMHHLVPNAVPFKGPSMSGISPLPNEVHGYAQRGQKDVMGFFPLSIGEFVVEDVRYPELTGRVVVFEVKD